MTGPDVVGSAEARALVGNVSRARFSTLARRPDFPKPRTLEIGRVWDRAEIEAWQAGRLAPRKATQLKALQSYRRTGSINRAAITAGVHHSTVRRWLRDLGVPLPRAASDTAGTPGP